MSNGPSNKTEPVANRPREHLSETQEQPVAIVAWTDASGSHEVSVHHAVTIGSSPAVDIVIADSTVSGVHVEVDPRNDGIVIRDFSSTNGTEYGSLLVQQARARGEVRLRLGRTDVTVRPGTGTVRAALWPAPEFARLKGRSPAMRAFFERLAQIARTDHTAMIHGETGTGKELVAEAIHQFSRRKGRLFQIVDCGALKDELFESELFGHARGSFSGAHADREGAFEAADGGTLFLDEVGEIPLDMQPKLLRVLEAGTIRRLGETKSRNVDVRIISASHWDLREAVNRGAFREDLYHRLAVIPLRTPSLRERREDIPLLIEHFRSKHADLAPLPLHMVDAVVARDWPGNVRELRNFVARASALGWDQTLATQYVSSPPAAPASSAVAQAAVEPQAEPDERGPMNYFEAREGWRDAGARTFFIGLMKRFKNKDYMGAAIECGLHHSTLRKELKRLGIKLVPIE